MIHLYFILEEHPYYVLSLLTASDFEDFSVNLTFSSGASGREICHNISIIDDEVLEATETYTITLTSSDDDVSIANPTASLLILDAIDGTQA